jgi:hypothetical protein
MDLKNYNAFLAEHGRIAIDTVSLIDKAVQALLADLLPRTEPQTESRPEPSQPTQRSQVVAVAEAFWESAVRCISPTKMVQELGWPGTHAFIRAADDDLAYATARLREQLKKAEDARHVWYGKAVLLGERARKAERERDAAEAEVQKLTAELKKVACAADVKHPTRAERMLAWLRDGDRTGKLRTIADELERCVPEEALEESMQAGAPEVGEEFLCVGYSSDGAVKKGIFLTVQQLQKRDGFLGFWGSNGYWYALTDEGMTWIRFVKPSHGAEKGCL